MEPRWMEHAWACFGVREYAGPRSNAAVVQMYKDAGHAAIKDDAVPWCAAFVGACLQRGGATATGSLRARSYLDWGQAIDQPVYGCVAVLSRGANPALGHVGFLVGATPSHVFLLGGNQTNAVNVAKFKRSRLLGFRTLPATGAHPGVIPSVGAVAQPPPAAPALVVDAFAQCLPHVLEMEGGFSDDPHDPGGPTNKGVTLATWARFRGVRLNAGSRAALLRGLKAISDADLQTIYETKYWTPSRAADLPLGFDLAHFDASVNHGLTGAAKLLQRTLGVAEDGQIGPITLGAAWSTPIETLISRHADARAARYRSLPHFWRFGRGWLRRTQATERAARDRVRSRITHEPPQPNPPAVARSSPSQQETTMTDAKSNAPAKHWTKSLTLWGAFVTTMASVLPIVGPFFGFNVTSDMIRELGDQGLQVLHAIATFAGIVMTVVGRLRASSRLTN